MNPIKRISAVLLAGVLLALAGCATQREEASNWMSDAAVTTRVKKAIYDDPTLKVGDISVTTENHVVHLTGTVKNRGQAVKAVQVARKVEGVKLVKSELKVE